MEGKGNISDYRSKLDKTLSSPDLTNYEAIHTLVKNQILQSLDSGSQFEECAEYVVERRSKEMFNFLSMLRSASVSDDVDSSKSIEESQSGWKVKQDTDEFRVMYREGPKGTPFHTLLVEGYVDGPLDVCLCISCEADLYKKWWPQTSVPTFKVISSQCVRKVRIGEQISLVRMKVSWPLSSREALVHFFTLEYFQDGLIVVLLNSISDLVTVDKSTHGFTRDGISEAEDVVRIDVVGGFALQKVSADRSYFRTIANMDIKLDFVPPAFINFVSRQLVGSGFRLYKKEIASVSKGDEKFREALKDPMYTRIRAALYSHNTPLASPPLENRKSTSVMLEQQNPEARENNTSATTYSNDFDNRGVDSGAKNAFSDRNVLDEITELEEREQDTWNSCDGITDEIVEEVKADEAEQDFRTTNDTTEPFVPGMKNKVIISPEVQQALGTLEKAISILRGRNSNSTRDQSDIKNGLDEENGEELITSGIADQTRINDGSLLEQKNDPGNHGFRHKGSNSYLRETNQKKIAPASPDEGPIVSHSYVKTITALTVLENMTEHSLLNGDANSTKGERVSKTKNKKQRFCCFVA